MKTWKKLLNDKPLSEISSKEIIRVFHESGEINFVKFLDNFYAYSKSLNIKPEKSHETNKLSIFSPILSGLRN